MLTNTVPCNLCGSMDYTVLFGPGVAQINQIVKCNRCGLIYANPRKDADHVDIEAWPDDPEWDSSRQHVQRFEKEQLQTRDYTNTRALINHLYPDRGRLLEIGSGFGFLLQTFRRDGWIVTGVEPDRNVVRYSAGKLGIETINGILETANIPDESFDVVIMLHVIEHVPDPVGTLGNIYRVLKPGGCLILETPRYDTLMFKLLGRRERSVSCGGHIYFFTTDSLRMAYEKAGFSLVQFEYVGRSLTLDRLAYNVAVMSKRTALQRIMKSLSRRLLFNKLKLTINLRDMQRVCVRKPMKTRTLAA
jgi:2-polyprenyl-3-methyl-5-hydroxy-6-metoxy-1,4-benzoquinol methylase